jgi:ABC-2 type transport system ATP-binding protein
MGQRLGIAGALLGNPQTLILDEPVNGLDPEGVLWVRELTRYLAKEGRTVFLSSHLMSEMAQTADHVIVLGKGRILADAPIVDILSAAAGKHVKVRSPQAQLLADQLAGPEVVVTHSSDGSLEISGLVAAQIGDAAARAGIVLHELTPVEASLEDAYLELTQDTVEYHSEALQ